MSIIADQHISSFEHHLGFFTSSPLAHRASLRTSIMSAFYHNRNLTLILTPQRIWFATLIWTPSSSAKVHTNPGLFWNIRPTKATSIPSSRSWFACLPLVIVPTVDTANLSPSFSLTAFAKGYILVSSLFRLEM